MDDIVILEWTFSPPDYFEEAIHVECENYTLVIDIGKVEACIDSAAYDKEHNLRDRLHDALNARFLGVQVLTHKSYELSKASICRLHTDGRRNLTVFPESGVLKMTGTVDYVVTDKDGNIISDSRRDRIDKKKELADLTQKYRSKDKFVESILDFYKDAVNDPDNELIHLFDIWEALSTKFKGENNARNALSITDPERSKLGNLANNDPLRQGRHRGRKIGELRDATGTELEEARGIARNMIEAYLHYLERQNTS